MRTASLALTAAAVITLGLSSVGVSHAAPSRCAELSGVVDGGQNCRIQATDPAYTLNITYPIDYPDQDAVFGYIKQTRDGFLNVAKAPGPHDMPYELDTTATEYTSTVPPRTSQSVVVKTYQSVGGARPLTFYKSFTWDQTARKPITADTLFRDGAQPWPLIYPVLITELTRQLGQPAAIPPSVGLDPSKYDTFALTNDSIVFFFDQGEILPESAGALEVSVPRAPIEGMLA
jgi:hypothetical protein